MEIFIVWLVLCILAGFYASSKGRSGIGIFIVSLLLSPLIGFIIALILENKNLIPCIMCGEVNKKGAQICRFCEGKIKD